MEKEIQKQKFLVGLAEIIEIDKSMINSELRLSALALWDSLAIVTTLGLIDEIYDLKIDAEKLIQCKTIADVMYLIKNDNKSRW